MKKNTAINLLIAVIFFLSAGTASANCVWTLHDKCEEISLLQSWTQRDTQCQDRKKPNASTAKCCCADDKTTGCCEITWRESNISASQETGESCQKKAGKLSYKFYPDGQANNNKCTGATAKPIEINTELVDSPTTNSQPSSQTKQEFSPLNYLAQVILPVPGSDLNNTSTTVGTYNSQTGKMTSDLLARYIKAVYDYGQMIAAILAAIVLMGGGLLWLTSAGNDSKITQAKELIGGSIVGLVILFSSYIILNTINPDLLKLKVITTQIAKPYYINDSGFIENENDIPKDMTYGWVCMNSTEQTCADTNPPTINLDHNLCSYGKPANAKPSNCGYGLLWCCGKSASDVQKSNICQGAENGTSCRLNSTSRLGSGYCQNNKCEPCKITGDSSASEGAPCNNHYECKNDILTCGSSGYGYCFCNTFGQNCTCRHSQPLW